MKIRGTVFLIWFFAVTISLLAQSSDLSGISFHSKNYPEFERTSIALNNGEAIEFEDNFTLSFDMAFWSMRRYGPIVRITDFNNTTIGLIVSQLEDGDSLNLALTLAEDIPPIMIPLDKKTFHRNKWFNFRLSLDLMRNKAAVYINNEQFGEYDTALPNPFAAHFFFGSKHTLPLKDLDCPAINLKNIKIETAGEHLHYWQLDPRKEDYDLDEIGGLPIQLERFDWIINRHYEWALLRTFETGYFTNGYFDTLKNVIYIARKSDLIIYDILTDEYEIIEYNGIRPGRWNLLRYNEVTDELYSTFLAMGEVSVFDWQSRTWSNIDTTNDKEGHYYGSVIFLNELNNELLLLGGYGWYTAKNDLYKYDFNKKKWVEIPFDKGDFFPRFGFAFGKGYNSGEYLIFGGQGNETGIQDNGFRELFDLWVLDMKDTSLTKIWNTDRFLFNYRFLAPFGYLNKSDSMFYFSGSTIDSTSNYIRLYQADLRKPEVKPASAFYDTGRLPAAEHIYQFFSTATGEFISIGNNDTIVKIRTLKYPPVDSTMLPVKKERTADLSDYYLFIFIGGGVILLLLYFIIRMRNKESNDSETGFELNSEPQSPQFYKNYLQLFGELAIYDKNGNEISSQFSEKPKEVFLLILTRSLGKNGNGGITSDELSAIIWPDSSPESAKSNRGVTISKIRKILKSADGIELVFENKSWRVKFKNGANCDYLEFLTLKEKLLNTEKLNNGTLELLCEITREGEYLKGISYEWLDAYKMAVNTEIMQFLKILLQSKEIEKSTELKIKICDLITGFDSVDEDAYTTKIAALYSQGNHKSAQNTYQIFIAEYRRLYDEDYPKTYNEIVNK